MPEELANTTGRQSLSTSVLGQIKLQGKEQNQKCHCAAL